MSTELVIYTDESDKAGEFFSNFYGGVLVRSKDLAGAISKLEAQKRQQNLFSEIKWSKVTANYLEKYKAMVDEFFDLVQADVAKVRIMFTSNQYVPQGLTTEQLRSQYHLLYYQFFKHAFGLQFSAQELESPIRVRLNLDQMPASKEQTAQFKSYVEGLLRYPPFRQGGIRFDAQQMAEVSSHHHVLLQCLDIVLGSMTFRLNNKHLAKPVGQKTGAIKRLPKRSSISTLCRGFDRFIRTSISAYPPVSREMLRIDGGIRIAIGN